MKEDQSGDSVERMNLIKELIANMFTISETLSREEIVASISAQIEDDPFFTGDV